MAGRKSFLYGLGSGLIAGAVLLQLASIGGSDALLTPEELEAAATANGYVLKDARTAWYSETELKERLAAAEEKVRSEIAKQPAKEPGAQAGRAGAGGGASDAGGGAGTGAGGSPGPEGGGEPAKIYAFTIASGTDLTTVARLLYELGLIDDYNGFLMLMEERGLAGKVQAKHYRFNSVPTTEELIEALIS